VRRVGGELTLTTSFVRAAGLALLAAVALALLPAADAAAQNRPNIIVVVTDDQSLNSMAEGPMPETERLLGERGATFTQAIVTTPMCCPSRSTLLTGQYAHNHNVLDNNPGYGALRQRRNVLPNWLRAAGYNTAHVGRWLNKYVTAVGDPERVAPGWHNWHTVISDNDSNLRYWAYRLRVNGKSERFGRSNRDHLTRVIGARSLRMIDRYAPRPKPFYLQVDHLAPHGSADPRLPCRRAAKPVTRDVGSFDDRSVDDGGRPAFNEANVSDKNSAVQATPPLDDTEIERVNRRWRCALASLREVDRNVARIVKRVREHRELKNTVFIFTSDNGFLFGEHRLSRKGMPYEEAVRVPLLIRLPERVRRGAPEGLEIPQAVANIDLAPTIVALARARPCFKGKCRTMDGRSLLPLLRGNTKAWPADRALLVEMTRRFPGEPGPERLMCAFAGVRTPEFAFHEFITVPAKDDPCPGPGEGEYEFYDLGSDPFQLDSEWDELSSGEQAVLRARLEDLRNCAGIAERDPLPPSGTYCE
jgi:arylsulfatase A-like enzyme